MKLDNIPEKGEKRLKQKNIVMVHIGKEIKTCMTRRHIPATWLAEQLGCSRTNVYKITAKAHIDTELLMKISRIVNYNFFQVYNSALLAEGIGSVDKTKKPAQGL